MLFTMPFGRHRGRPITTVPAGYLSWLTRELGIKNNIRRHAAAELLRRAEDARAQVERLNRLPTAEPCAVLGVALNAVEAGLFGEAVKAGELVVGPDMPVSSPVPEAWRRWCEWHEVEHAVREVGFSGDDQ